MGADFVNLTWTRPASDGGGRIRGYVVEKREVGAPNWNRITQQPLMTTSYNVPHLLEDSTYEFRVIAINDAGEGEPTVIDRPVLVKDPLGEPWMSAYFSLFHTIALYTIHALCLLVRDSSVNPHFVIISAVTRPTFVGSLRSSTVNEGRDAVFEIEVNCPSNYEVVWSKGPRDLVPSHRIDMTKEGRKQVLTIHDCGMEDAEEYSIKVFNRAGSKLSRANLAVKCKY